MYSKTHWTEFETDFFSKNKTCFWNYWPGKLNFKLTDSSFHLNRIFSNDFTFKDKIKSYTYISKQFTKNPPTKSPFSLNYEIKQSKLWSLMIQFHVHYFWWIYSHTSEVGYSGLKEHFQTYAYKLPRRWCTWNPKSCVILIYFVLFHNWNIVLLLWIFMYRARYFTDFGRFSGKF